MFWVIYNGVDISCGWDQAASDCSGVIEHLKRQCWEIHFLNERVRNSLKLSSTIDWINNHMFRLSVPSEMVCQSAKLYQTKFPLFYSTIPSSGCNYREMKLAEIICDLVRYKNFKPNRLLVVSDHATSDNLIDIDFLDKFLRQLFSGDDNDGARCPFLIYDARMLLDEDEDIISGMCDQAFNVMENELHQIEQRFSQTDKVNDLWGKNFIKAFKLRQMNPRYHHGDVSVYTEILFSSS
jgi:hypothetical protein